MIPSSFFSSGYVTTPSASVSSQKGNQSADSSQLMGRVLQAGGEHERSPQGSSLVRRRSSSAHPVLKTPKANPLKALEDCLSQLGRVEEWTEQTTREIVALFAQNKDLFSDLSMGFSHHFSKKTTDQLWNIRHRLLTTFLNEKATKQKDDHNRLITQFIVEDLAPEGLMLRKHQGNTALTGLLKANIPPNALSEILDLCPKEKKSVFLNACDGYGNLPLVFVLQNRPKKFHFLSKGSGTERDIYLHLKEELKVTCARMRAFDAPFFSQIEKEITLGDQTKVSQIILNMISKEEKRLAPDGEKSPFRAHPSLKERLLKALLKDWHSGTDHTLLTLELLVSHGANVTLADGKGVTLLQAASQQGSRALFKRILEDPKFRGPQGYEEAEKKAIIFASEGGVVKHVQDIVEVISDARLREELSFFLVSFLKSSDRGGLAWFLERLERKEITLSRAQTMEVLNQVSDHTSGKKESSYGTISAFLGDRKNKGIDFSSEEIEELTSTCVLRNNLFALQDFLEFFEKDNKVSAPLLRTLLMYACEHGYKSMMTYLLGWVFRIGKINQIEIYPLMEKAIQVQKPEMITFISKNILSLGEAVYPFFGYDYRGLLSQVPEQNGLPYTVAIFNLMKDHTKDTDEDPLLTLQFHIMQVPGRNMLIGHFFDIHRMHQRKSPRSQLESYVRWLVPLDFSKDGSCLAVKAFLKNILNQGLNIFPDFSSSEPRERNKVRSLFPMLLREAAKKECPAFLKVCFSAAQELGIEIPQQLFHPDLVASDSYSWFEKAMEKLADVAVIQGDIEALKVLLHIFKTLEAPSNMLESFCTTAIYVKNPGLLSDLLSLQDHGGMYLSREDIEEFMDKALNIRHKQTKGSTIMTILYSEQKKGVDIFRREESVPLNMLERFGTPILESRILRENGQAIVTFKNSESWFAYCCNKIIEEDSDYLSTFFRLLITNNMKITGEAILEVLEDAEADTQEILHLTRKFKLEVSLDDVFNALDRALLNNEEDLEKSLFLFAVAYGLCSEDDDLRALRDQVQKNREDKRLG